MKKRIFLILLLFLCLNTLGQKQDPVFKDGEWLRYKMSYSGFLRAGTAVLKLEEKELPGEKSFSLCWHGLDFWNDQMVF